MLEWFVAFTCLNAAYSAMCNESLGSSNRLRPSIVGSVNRLKLEVWSLKWWKLARRMHTGSLILESDIKPLIVITKSKDRETGTW